MGENSQRTGAAAGNDVRAAAADANFGDRGRDAAIDRGAVGVAGEAYFRSQHSGEPEIPFGPRRRRAPIEGDAAQSRERADTAALARTWFDSGPAPVTSVSAPRRKASATTKSNERTLLPPKATGRRSSRLNHSVGLPSAAESRRARMIGVGSVTSERRGRASSRAAQAVMAHAFLTPSPARGRPAPDIGRSGCQFASNRDPFFASNRDPC